MVDPSAAVREGRRTGALLLVPNTLDLGTEAVPIEDVIAAGVLRQAAHLTHWVVEDAKSARAFLKRVAQTVPLARPLQELSIHELPRPPKGTPARHAPPRTAAPAPWLALLQPALEGHDIGVLSEAGLPAVADPGAALVAAAHEAGLRVQPLAGPSSLVLALAASGLDGQSFAFVGYLPADAPARAARITELEAHARRSGQTQVFIETPYRNRVMLQALLEHLAPGTRLAVSVGLTLPGGWSRMARVAAWRANPPTLPERTPAVFVLAA